MLNVYLLRNHRHWIAPTVFIMPGAVLFGVVIILASAQTIWVSFFDWDGVGAKQWVGLANNAQLLDDPRFYVSLKNNLIWLSMFMLAPPLGLALALLLNQPIRGMKSLFFVPLVLASVTVGVVFTWSMIPPSAFCRSSSAFSGRPLRRCFRTSIWSPSPSSWRRSTRPRSKSLIGRTRRPFWKDSVKVGAMLLGTAPPMSEACTKDHPKAISFSSRKIG
jgi:hypothetical protein